MAVHRHPEPSPPAGYANAGPKKGSVRGPVRAPMTKPLRQPLRMGDAVPSCGIAVMAKASIPGRTKTRLVPPLTFEEAAAFNTAFLQDVAANILTAANRMNISGYMAFRPPESA